MFNGQLFPTKRIHIAIMRKSWGLLEKIISGQKKIESRWYKIKYPPWGNIANGDVIYFKNSGEPISLKSEVKKVIQLKNLTPNRVKEILAKYGRDDGLSKADLPKFYDLFKDKKYCLLVFLEKSRRTKPFQINKSGFGAMASWIIIDDIKKIMLKNN